MSEIEKMEKAVSMLQVEYGKLKREEEICAKLAEELECAELSWLALRFSAIKMTLTTKIFILQGYFNARQYKERAREAKEMEA